MSLLKFLESSEEIKKLLSYKDKFTTITPLAGSLKSVFTKYLSEKENQIFLLLPDVQSLSEIKVELDILGCNDIIVIDELNIEALQEKLTLISNKKNFILISTYEILNVILPAKNQIEKSTSKIQLGGGITYEEIIEYLNLLNYQKTKFVEGAGDFAVRGSIIDVWSYSEANPCRIEFDGDFIESIRHFDVESQRSADKVEFVSLAANFYYSDTVFSADIFDYLNNPLILANKYELNSLLKK